MVWQGGVGGDAVAFAELVSLPVDEELDASLEHDGGLAAARLVHRWIVRPSGGGAGRKRVLRDVGALARQRRSELIHGVPAAPAGATLAGMHDDHMAILVEAKQL